MKKNFDEALLVDLRVDSSYPEPILHQVLRIAIYDEFHAYETYNQVVTRFGPVKPFMNIREAEIRHCAALTPLFWKYQVPMPINNWAAKIRVPDTLLECCAVGVAAEIDNVAMYDNLLGYTRETDIRNVLTRLRAASLNNHLPAFRNCVAKLSGSTGLNVLHGARSTHWTQDGLSRNADGPMFMTGVLLGAAGVVLGSRWLKNSPAPHE